MSDDKIEVQEPENQTPEQVEAAKVAETAALATVTDEDVQAQIIEKFGLDAETDAELIGKMVADKKEEHKKLGTAIKQKQGWRTKATSKPSGEPADSKAEKPAPEAPAGVLTPETLDERLDERELNATNLSDELKAEVKNYSKLHKCSIKESQASPYILFKIEEDAKAARIDKAGIGGDKKTQPTVNNFADTEFSDFDLTTEEGRAGWAKYKEWLKENPNG